MSRASANRPGNTRAPATRDQVDAYRFGLRRLEAALVRGDPVPLHEQIRSQRRAALAGVVLGLLGLCGTAVFALISPRPDWTQQSVVISASGAMYVVAHGPDRLVPVANIAAGRLVLAALRNGGATNADPGTATPVSVPDDALDRAPRTPVAALAGAVGVRPGGPALAPRWAVCDETAADGSGPVTTVIGGADLPAPAPPSDGVLLTGPDDVTWLVTGGQRHRVDIGDGGLQAAFGLKDRVPRAAAADLISVLPEGPALVRPAIEGRTDPGPANLPDRVGDVLITRPVGGPPQYFVVLRDGLQEVPEMVAGLLRVASGVPKAREVGTDVVGDTDTVHELQVDGWPAGAPRMQEPAEAPVVCWTWTADGEPTGDIWIGSSLPLPAGATPVSLAQADGPGRKVDAVALGAGGAVRSTGPGRAPGAGPLWLVSPTGVAYAVADDDTAAALGITAADAAPEAALRLLPAGHGLDLAEAGRIVDVLPTG